MSKLKYKLQRLRYWKILFSPFKPFRIRFYFGKIAIGVPYFLPRKWVKYTEADTIKAAHEAINKPQFVKKSYEEWINSYKNYSKAVPLKFGFSSCGLGWKTKWSDTDYRYEYGPVLSFVCLGYQIALSIGHKHPDHYWTAWLYYEYNTDKTKSKKERIEQCKKDFPQTYIVYHKSPKTGKNSIQETIDYYKLILKPKYI
jgi:hypothetical protein